MSDVSCPVLAKTKEKKQKRRMGGGGKKGAQKKKCKKKTDRLLEFLKPRDTFESLEMHLFFLERERRKRKMSPNHSTQKLCIIRVFHRAM